MIDESNPDYKNTPASAIRPLYSYAPLNYGTPLVSVITPYYNVSPIFLETVRCVQRMSYPHWEWIIVDDGSTQPESLAQLADIAEADKRITVITQPNQGPSAARNRAVAAARGRYLLQLDADDMVEPTFVEKSIWVMETQPQFAACSAYNVTFGKRPLIWNHGFQSYERNLTMENFVTSQAMIRRDAYLAAGGYDESIVRGHEDWDFWLNLAEAGLWGYTIPEHLTWYRTSEVSRSLETVGVGDRHKAFHTWLMQKHDRLRYHFPHPTFESGVDQPHAAIRTQSPINNPLAKPEGTKRILFVVPWLTMGGADKFNLDLARMLSRRGYEFTIVATLNSDQKWLHEFARVTPDVFILPTFLQYADYPRFLSYLVESRQIDSVLISNSEMGYGLVPFLRAHHPRLPILDYVHVEEEHWNNGGHPWTSVRMRSQLDVSVTSTEHLKKWMVGRGADSDQIQVVHANIDTEQWNPALYDTNSTRRRLGIDQDTIIVLYVGRVVEQKRPLMWVEILSRLARTHKNFIGLVIGDGNLLSEMKSHVQRHKLQQRVRFMGPLPNPEVRKLMAAADILLLPSMYEGLALVLYEALAMNTVPVATAFGGHGELVTPACGYLIPASDREIEQYTEALRQLVVAPEKLSSMASAGRERVEQHFALEQMADGMELAIACAGRKAGARPGAAADPVLAQQFASLVIENHRLTAVADRLWHDLHSSGRSSRPRSIGGTVRWVRSRLLPIGTGRYEVYKRIRRTLLPRRHYADEVGPLVQDGPDRALALSETMSTDAPGQSTESDREEPIASKVVALDTDAIPNDGATHQNGKGAMDSAVIAE